MVACNNLEGKCREGRRLEWVSKGDHLEKEHTKCPYVRECIVRPSLDELGREIVRCADARLRKVARVIHLTGDPEITQLDEVTFRQEDVGSLDVAVQHTARVNKL